MASVPTRLYEGLFLFPQSATADLDGALKQVEEILNRAEAEILIMNKWDDRRLAYPMRGQKRGAYFLSYFNARPAQIANIERDVTLSEQVLRCLILKADHIGETELDLAKKGPDAATEAKLRDETPSNEKKSSGAVPKPVSSDSAVAVQPEETPDKPSPKPNRTSESTD